MKTKLISKIFMTLAFAFQGCSSIYLNHSNLLENSPIEIIEEQTLSFANDKRLEELYKKYFPNNKLEIGYKLQESKYDIKFFINPGLKKDLEFQVLFGMETKF